MVGYVCLSERGRGLGCMCVCDVCVCVCVCTIHRVSFSGCMPLILLGSSFSPCLRWSCKTATAPLGLHSVTPHTPHTKHTILCVCVCTWHLVAGGAFVCMCWHGCAVCVCVCACVCVCVCACVRVCVCVGRLAWLHDGQQQLKKASSCGLSNHYLQRANATLFTSRK